MTKENMKKLYKVQTKQYKDYYVLADGYDEAVGKAKHAIILERQSLNLFDSDGSLRKEFLNDDIEIIRVEFLTNDLY